MKESSKLKICTRYVHTNEAALEVKRMPTCNSVYLVFIQCLLQSTLSPGAHFRKTGLKTRSSNLNAESQNSPMSNSEFSVSEQSWVNEFRVTVVHGDVKGLINGTQIT